MSNVLRTVEGHEIVTSGSLICPSPDRCDLRRGERYEAYVERHCADHEIDLSFSENAERNLGLWCFYYDHKFIYGNKTLIAQPFWEIHAFIAEDEWNEIDLEERIPIRQKTFARIPDANLRRPGDVRSMKQVEIPRQCEKTSTGAEAYTVFLSKREYFVNDVRNYPIFIRSETTLNAGDSLRTIKMRCTRRAKIRDLYGVQLLTCPACSESRQVPFGDPKVCPACGATKKIRSQRISLIDLTRGAGGTKDDSITFRWATDLGNVDPDDEDAVYSVRAVGLFTRVTGQRPRRYILDDIQTADNSDSHEKREKLRKRFDEAVRQVEFGGQMVVINTRKFPDDFCAQISKEPLRSMFHTLHRRVYWPTTEPDNPPYVVDGMRYYYPINGLGKPALDARQVAAYERLMVERDFAAEFLNDPTDEKRAVFKREHFKIVSRSENQSDWSTGQDRMVPPEIRFGLGREVTPSEQDELLQQNVRIFALNSCDPAGIEVQKKSGDDNFIVAMRRDRHGAIYVTRLIAGKWASRRVWEEIYKADLYNHPQFTDYEMPASELHIKDSHDKWIREKSEALSAINEQPVVISVPMKFSHMPKSSKRSREDQMEMYLPIYILDDAGGDDPGIIEKFIGQWLSLSSGSGHDDGPDALSRLARWFTGGKYKQPGKQEEEQGIKIIDGEQHIPLGLIKAMQRPAATKGLWGQQGVPR